ncbi:MAG: hypothetical protein HQK78_06005 [Desulfobacterales bacterium]|nr:hypothetical protein [Desulfobacterales bacterium]
MKFLEINSLSQRIKYIPEIEYIKISAPDPILVHQMTKIVQALTDRMAAITYSETSIPFFNHTFYEQLFEKIERGSYTLYTKIIQSANYHLLENIEGYREYLNKFNDFFKATKEISFKTAHGKPKNLTASLIRQAKYDKNNKQPTTVHILNVKTNALIHPKVKSLFPENTKVLVAVAIFKDENPIGILYGLMDFIPNKNQEADLTSQLRSLSDSVSNIISTQLTPDLKIGLNAPMNTLFQHLLTNLLGLINRIILPSKPDFDSQLQISADNFLPIQIKNTITNVSRFISSSSLMIKKDLKQHYRRDLIEILFRLIEILYKPKEKKKTFDYINANIRKIDTRITYKSFFKVDRSIQIGDIPEEVQDVAIEQLFVAFNKRKNIRPYIFEAIEGISEADSIEIWKILLQNGVLRLSDQYKVLNDTDIQLNDKVVSKTDILSKYGDNYEYILHFFEEKGNDLLVFKPIFNNDDILILRALGIYEGLRDIYLQTKSKLDQMSIEEISTITAVFAEGFDPNKKRIKLKLGDVYEKYEQEILDLLKRGAGFRIDLNYIIPTIQKGFNVSIKLLIPEALNKTKKIQLFIPGLINDRYAGDDIVKQAVKKGYIAASVNMRGRGRYTTPNEIPHEGWSIDDYYKYDFPVVLKFLNKMFPDYEFVCIGHSMGGIIIRSYITLFEEIKEETGQEDLVPPKKISHVVSIASPRTIEMSFGSKVFEFLKHLIRIPKMQDFLKECVKYPPFANRTLNFEEFFNLFHHVYSLKMDKNFAGGDVPFIKNIIGFPDIPPYVYQSLETDGLAEEHAKVFLQFAFSELYEDKQLYSYDGRYNLTLKEREMTQPHFSIDAENDVVAPIQNTSYNLGKTKSIDERHYVFTKDEWGENGHERLLIDKQMSSEIARKIESWLNEYNHFNFESL